MIVLGKGNNFQEPEFLFGAPITYKNFFFKLRIGNVSLFHYANLSNPSILYHRGLLHMKQWDWEDCIDKPDQAICLHESNTISQQTNGMHGPKRNNAKADQCRIMGAMPSCQSNAPVPELYPCQSIPMSELIDKNDHANEKCYLKLLLLITFMLLKTN